MSLNLAELEDELARLESMSDKAQSSEDWRYICLLEEELVRTYLKGISVKGMVDKLIASDLSKHATVKGPPNASD